MNRSFFVVAVEISILFNPYRYGGSYHTLHSHSKFGYSCKSFYFNALNSSYTLFSRLSLHRQSIGTHKSQQYCSEYPLRQMMAWWMFPMHYRHPLLSRDWYRICSHVRRLRIYAYGLRLECPRRVDVAPGPVLLDQPTVRLDGHALIQCEIDRQSPLFAQGNLNSEKKKQKKKNRLILTQAN